MFEKKFKISKILFLAELLFFMDVFRLMVTIALPKNKIFPVFFKSHFENNFIYFYIELFGAHISICKDLISHIRSASEFYCLPYFFYFIIGKMKVSFLFL